MLPILEEDTSPEIQILSDNESTAESGVESDSSTNARACQFTSDSQNVSVSSSARADVHGNKFVPNEDQERQQLLALQFSESPNQSPRKHGRSHSVGYEPTSPAGVYYEHLPKDQNLTFLQNVNGTHDFHPWRQEIQRLQQQLPQGEITNTMSRLLHLQSLVHGCEPMNGSMTPTTNEAKMFNFSDTGHVQPPTSTSFSPLAGTPATKPSHRRHHSIAHQSEYSLATPTTQPTKAKTKIRARKKRALSATAQTRLKNKSQLQDAYAHLLQDEKPPKTFIRKLSNEFDFPSIEHVVMAN